MKAIIIYTSFILSIAGIAGCKKVSSSVQNSNIDSLPLNYIVADINGRHQVLFDTVDMIASSDDSSFLFLAGTGNAAANYEQIQMTFNFNSPLNIDTLPSQFPLFNSYPPNADQMGFTISYFLNANRDPNFPTGYVAYGSTSNFTNNVIYNGSATITHFGKTDSIVQGSFHGVITQFYQPIILDRAATNARPYASYPDSIVIANGRFNLKLWPPIR